MPLPRMHLVRYRRLPGAAQPPAWGHRPDAPPAEDGGRGARHGIAALELGAAAQAGVCPGHGALFVLSAGDTADHRRHHAGRGDPEDPSASEIVCRPPHWPRRVSARKPSPGPQPERRRRLLLRRRLLAARGWGSLAALCPSTPSTSRGCSCAAPLVVAACSTPTRVCTRLSRRPSAAPPALQALCISLFRLIALNQSPQRGPACTHCVESVPSQFFQQYPAPPVSLSSAHRPQRAAAWRPKLARPPPLPRRRAGAHCRWRSVGAAGEWKRPFDFPIRARRTSCGYTDPR